MSFAPKFGKNPFTAHQRELEQIDILESNDRIRKILERCGLENTGRDAVKFIIRMQNLINCHDNIS